MTFRLWVLGWFCWKLRLRLFKIAGLLMQVCKCIPIEVNRIESNRIKSSVSTEFKGLGGNRYDTRPEHDQIF